jgi:hypothetical protein
MDRQEVTKQCQKTFQAGDGKFKTFTMSIQVVGLLAKKAWSQLPVWFNMNEALKNNLEVNQPFEANNTQYKTMLILVIYVENTLVAP